MIYFLVSALSSFSLSLPLSLLVSHGMRWKFLEAWLTQPWSRV
jgi:hypothetical protein